MIPTYTMCVSRHVEQLTRKRPAIVRGMENVAHQLLQLVSESRKKHSPIAAGWRIRMERGQVQHTLVRGPWMLVQLSAASEVSIAMHVVQTYAIAHAHDESISTKFMPSATSHVRCCMISHFLLAEHPKMSALLPFGDQAMPAQDRQSHSTAGYAIMHVPRRTRSR
jgi:hypothetical protein